mgnify:CR=1 FL=1
MRRKKKRQKTGFRVCFYCKENFSISNITKDHFIPQSMGAPTKGNIVPACLKCNGEKANRAPNPAEIERFIKVYGHYPGGETGKAIMARATRWYGKDYMSDSQRFGIRIENMLSGAKQRVLAFIEEEVIRAQKEIEEIR